MHDQLVHIIYKHFLQNSPFLLHSVADRTAISFANIIHTHKCLSRSEYIRNFISVVQTEKLIALAQTPCNQLHQVQCT